MKTWRIGAVALIALPLCFAEIAPVAAQPVPPHVAPPVVAPAHPRVRPRPARVAPRPRPPVVTPPVPGPVRVVPKRLPKP